MLTHMKPEDLSPDHFNVEDVEYEWAHNKSGCAITLTMRSGERFNLMKTYLSLKCLIDRIELEIGIMDAAPEEQ